MAFGTMTVNPLDQLGPAGFLPEGLRESPLEDLSRDRGWPRSLDGGDDVFEFAEILLPDAPAAVVDACPVGVIVVGVAFDPFGFEAFQSILPGDGGRDVRAYRIGFQA
jgi:hypothetical protein